MIPLYPILRIDAMAYFVFRFYIGYYFKAIGLATGSFMTSIRLSSIANHLIRWDSTRLFGQVIFSLKSKYNKFIPTKVML